mmetsp:Transcript_15242/g.22353  ORF Transcript_15242/g.22353 Transcript_15242/m.22353 type:complete len:214 (-) Transcript_15242:82-723(-)
MLVEMRKMLRGCVSTTKALSIHHPVVQTFTVAALLSTEIMCHGVNPKKSDQRVKLSDPILQRRSRKAPSMNRYESKCSTCRLTTTSLDHVGLVQDYAPPAQAMKDAHLRTCGRLLHQSVHIDTSKRIIVIIVVVTTTFLLSFASLRLLRSSFWCFGEFLSRCFLGHLPQRLFLFLTVRAVWVSFRRVFDTNFSFLDWNFVFRAPIQVIIARFT